MVSASLQCRDRHGRTILADWGSRGFSIVRTSIGAGTKELLADPEQVNKNVRPKKDR